MLAGLISTMMRVLGRQLMGLGLTRVGSCAGVYVLVEGVDAIGWRLARVSRSRSCVD